MGDFMMHGVENLCLYLFWIRTTNHFDRILENRYFIRQHKTIVWPAAAERHALV